jgi:microcin C transport system substrate-binding protein
MRHLLLALALLSPFPAFADGHAIALHGAPKYPAGFAHFDYVSPDAPKGGTVRLGGFGSFDTLNPFTLKGEAANGLGLVYDTLLTSSADEASVEYGLLAEKVEVAADKLSVTFTLNPAAKFADGNPVTGGDVVWSFNTLIEKGAPTYKLYYADVAGVSAKGNIVTFTFKNAGNRELPLILGQLPVLPAQAWAGKDFSATTLELPLGSGPYRVKEAQPGRRIVLERRDDYWAKDLNVNKGRYNYDTLQWDYYRDLGVMFEAFKAGELDYWAEFKAQNWATGYDVPAVKEGRIKRELIDNEDPQGMQGFAINTRCEIFKDVRVRQALGLLFDFEWTNANIFYGQYTRAKSYFSNSELASSGVPLGRELEILEPFRKDLPPELFTKPFTPSVTKGDGNIREQMKQAADLFKAAGWELQKGVMTNTATGKPLTFEILVAQDAFERVLLPYVANLQRLGIKASLRRIDTPQYINRMNDFNYDMTVLTIPQSLSPGNEQVSYWSSQSAGMNGSKNYMNVSNSVVDALVGQIIAAPTREELVAVTRALDRVLLWGYYVVPNWYVDGSRVAWWNRFAEPKVRQKYGVGFLDAWWVDGALDAALVKK